MDPVTLGKLMEDIVDLVKQGEEQHAVRSQRPIHWSDAPECRGIPETVMIGSLRGAMRSQYRAKSGRRWTLSTRFIGWELPGLLEKIEQVEVVKTVDRNGMKLMRLIRTKR